MMKGFTLVETLIGSFIALIVGTLLVSILVNQSGFMSKQNSIVNEGLTLNSATSQIENYIRQSVSVIPSYPAISPQFTSGSESIVLQLASTNSTGVINGAYDYAVITKDTAHPSVLRLQIFSDSRSNRKNVNLVLTSILQNIQFSYTDKNENSVTPALASSVSVTLTVLSKTGSVGSSRSSTITTTLRNFGT